MHLNIPAVTWGLISYLWSFEITIMHLSPCILKMNSNHIIKMFLSISSALFTLPNIHTLSTWYFKGPLKASVAARICHPSTWEMETGRPGVQSQTCIQARPWPTWWTTWIPVWNPSLAFKVPLNLAQAILARQSSLVAKSINLEQDWHVKRWQGDWKAALEVKCTGCSSRGPGLNSQHPHGSS